MFDHQGHGLWGNLHPVTPNDQMRCHWTRLGASEPSQTELIIPR